MSTGYLVMRWVTSRMHSCTPCRFSTAKRVTFYKGRGRAQGQSGPEGRATWRTPNLGAYALVLALTWPSTSCWLR